MQDQLICEYIKNYITLTFMRGFDAQNPSAHATLKRNILLLAKHLITYRA